MEEKLILVDCVKMKLHYFNGWQDVIKKGGLKKIFGAEYKNIRSQDSFNRVSFDTSCFECMGEEIELSNKVKTLISQA